MKTHLSKRPAGLTAVAASLLVIVAKQAGLDLSEQEAALIVTGLTAIVSALYPRVAHDLTVVAHADGQEIAQAVARKR